MTSSTVSIDRECTSSSRLSQYMVKKAVTSQTERIVTVMYGNVEFSCCTTSHTIHTINVLVTPRPSKVVRSTL
jgi:hypothetical protein